MPSYLELTPRVEDTLSEATAPPRGSTPAEETSKTNSAIFSSEFDYEVTPKAPYAVGYKDRLPVYVGPTGNEHTHTVILLHDAHSDGEQLKEEFMTASKATTHFPTAKFVFPSAPDQLWFKTSRPSHNADPNQKAETARLAPAAWYIRRLIAQEAEVFQESDIPTENDGFDRIILVGVGQGCAAGILTLLRGNKQLGGFIGLSGWLPLEKELSYILSNKRSPFSFLTLSNLAKFRPWDTDAHAEYQSRPGTSVNNAINLVRRAINRKPANLRDKACKMTEFLHEADDGPFPRPVEIVWECVQHLTLEGCPDFGEYTWPEKNTGDRHVLYTPILLCHGAADFITSYNESRNMRNVLADWDKLGMPVTYKEYNYLGHSINSLEEMNDIVSFLTRECGVPRMTHFHELKEMEEEWAAYFEDGTEDDSSHSEHESFN